MERTQVLGAPADRPDELAAGRAIRDWVVVRRIGGGGFGAVYEVHHRRTDQRAALKLLHAQLVTSAEVLLRFDREIQVLRRLRHRSVVELVDAGFSDDGRPFLCMELLDGDELGAVIEQRGALPVAVAAQVLEPLCEALAYAHELGVIHRDVKASNVVVSADLARVVLLDFGIAKLADALAPELTASRQSLGTPSCMAPEQIHGLRVDARTDVYALGGVLFHMLTGRMPFADASMTMTQYLHLHARRPHASKLAPVPPRLDDVIVRAMAIEPADRFADPRSLLAAVRAATRESRVHAAVRDVELTAVYVTVGDRGAGASLDERLLADLEAVLPAAERFLAGHGYALAVDLGTSAIFVAPAATGLEVATAAWHHLTTRPTRDPRVRVGLGVHRARAPYVGAEIQPCEMLRVSTWGMPEVLDGVWAAGRYVIA